LSSYTDTTDVDLFVNGLRLRPGVDYVVNGNVLYVSRFLNAGDVIQIDSKVLPLAPAPVNYYLQEDGSGRFLAEDGSTLFILEQAVSAVQPLLTTTETTLETLEVLEAEAVQVLPRFQEQRTA